LHYVPAGPCQNAEKGSQRQNPGALAARGPGGKEDRGRDPDALRWRGRPAAMCYDGHWEDGMGEMDWNVAILVLLVPVSVVGLAYVIVEWVYSDAPDAPRPWQRRRRAASGRRIAPIDAATETGSLDCDRPQKKLAETADNRERG
jgi:hypothetical protein